MAIGGDGRRDQESRGKRGLFITARFKYHDLKTGSLAQKAAPLPPSFAPPSVRRGRAQQCARPRRRRGARGIIIINGYVLCLGLLQKNC